MNVIKQFLVALSFFTRIPINLRNVSEREFYRSLIFIPVVGLIIGLVLYILTKILIYIDYIPLESLVILFSYFYITGGLHLDGLADTFDALYSSKSKEFIFEIMKDSRIGTFGALSLILITLSYYCTFSYLLEFNINILFLLFPIIGRFCAIELGALSIAAPEGGGLGKRFCKEINIKIFVIYLIFLILLCTFLNYRVLFSTIGIILITLVEVFYFKKKLGGITGDQIGMVIEINQVLFLFIFIILNQILG